MQSANTAIFESIEERKYADFLENLGYGYKQAGNYLQMGDIPAGDGWILYISVVYIDLLPLLQDILPVLRKQKAAAFIPRDPRVAVSLLAGHLGSQHIGKVIGVLPVKGRETDLLLQLRQYTTSYRGQKVYDTYCVGENIYAAYYKLYNQDLFRTRDEWLGSMTLLDLVICEVPVTDRFYHRKNWPLGTAAKMEVLRSKDKRVHHGYFEQEVLKNDSKGKVSTIKSLLRMPLYKTYVAKQGEKHVSSDFAGRDITDRLKWQFEIHRELHGKIPIPKPVELIEDGDNVTFVMEFIEGPSLTQVIDQCYSYCSGWSELEEKNRQLLLRLLVELISTIETMHALGYIHRDINSENFLVDGNNKAVCIDLELAYSMRKDYPSPPFVYGTYGYMSPEQKRVDTPSAAQDVYSLGALMIKLFTGLSPVLLNTDATDQLYSAMEFLIADGEIASAICGCMAQEPSDRMKLPALKQFLQNYLPNRSVGGRAATLDKHHLQLIVRQGLSGVGNPQMINSDGLWVSKVKLGSVVENEEVNLKPLLGIHTGIAGPLHLLLSAYHVGWDLEKYAEYINTNFNFVISSILSRPGILNNSLYHGLPGVAVVLQQAVNAGWLSPFPELSKILQQVATVDGGDLSVANGLAGQGLALLQMSSLIGAIEKRDALAEITETIINTQDQDGSWMMPWIDATGSRFKVLGMDHGIAGIIYFLLRYFEDFKDHKAFDAAIAGLRYMQLMASKNGDHMSWPVYVGASQRDLWWAYGITGMCIPFIKAYQIAREPDYKKTAEDVLHNHLFRMATPSWGISNGIAGLGHVYLSAYQAFGNEEWMERASWITGFFSRVYSRPDQSSMSWIVDNSTVSTADLMSGAAGVVHYLLRYFLPEDIKYPIIK